MYLDLNGTPTVFTLFVGGLWKEKKRLFEGKYYQTLHLGDLPSSAPSPHIQPGLPVHLSQHAVLHQSRGAARCPAAGEDRRRREGSSTACIR